MRIEDERTLAGLVLALGVFVALSAPGLSHIFAPYLYHSLFFIVVFSLLPFARQNLSELVNLHPAIASMVFWQQFLLPAFVLAAGNIIGVDSQMLFLFMVVLSSGSLFASPTLVQIMGLDHKLAMQSVVLSTLAAPLSIYVSFQFTSGSHASIDLQEFAIRTGIFLVAPILVLVIVHILTKNLSANSSRTFERAGRWGSVLSLLIFCFALEEQVALMFIEDPEKVFSFLAIAVSVSVVSAFLTRIVMAHHGAYAATTSCVLASFRNVGLTYGLVAGSGNSDLVIFVGVCQIPMFFTPLVFDLFFGSSRRAVNSNADQADHGGVAECQTARDPLPDKLDPGNSPTGNLGLIHQKEDNFRIIGQLLSPINSKFSAQAISNGQNITRRSNMATSNTAIAPEVETENFAIESEATRSEELVDRLREQRDEAKAQIASIETEISEARSTKFYLAALIGLLVLGMAIIWQANKYVSPMLFDQNLIDQVAETHIAGKNFATFDLNINIRDLREATISRMTETPEAVVLGASHWQEAHVELVSGKKFYNSHVHRDYYEDMLAVTDMFVRNNKLPAEMIITIRDNLFTPIKDRTDFLWLPGIKYYRNMADRLGIEAHSLWETLPVNTWRELVSLPLLWSQASRGATAPVQPHVTDQNRHETLDILLPGGSIVWSDEHKRMFTAERARREALAFTDARRNDPPRIDPKGVAHMESLLTFLAENNVKVTLAHPPFNPIFWKAVQGSPYREGLRQVEQLTAGWAKKFNLPMIGGFSPESVGCTADMYIDAEHSNSKCLGMLLNQYTGNNDMRELRGTLTW